MIRGSVKGRAELRDVITKLEVTAPRDLEKDLLTGTREALKPIKADVQKSAVARLPKQNGYNALLAKAVRVSTVVTGGKKINANITVRAIGQREERDVRALNRGVLKHPLYGNRLHWYTTRVRRGLVDEPIDDARDRVVDNARDAAEAYARTVARG